MLNTCLKKQPIIGLRLLRKGDLMDSNSLFSKLFIGDIAVDIPIVQGGMGVDVSSCGLAAAVSNAGGLGVVAAVGASQHCENTQLGYAERSYQGLRRILRKTRELTDRPFGVNIMYALSDYDELVRAAVDENAAVIISGAGLPLHLPRLVGASPVKLVPVVSSGRAASIICRTWWKKYRRIPDAVIVEGTAAGGHLGFSYEELGNPRSLGEIVVEVVEYARTVELEHGCRIPVIAAGGIFTGADIAAILKSGASGVQMGTRFVCTDECDADRRFKEMYVKSTESDIVIIKSPVGMPLRVLRNKFVEDLLRDGRKPFCCTYHCLKTCVPGKSPYCIANALNIAARGNVDDGLVTCGANAYRVKEIVPVRRLLSELVEECRNCLAD